MPILAKTVGSLTFAVLIMLASTSSLWAQAPDPTEQRANAGPAGSTLSDADSLTQSARKAPEDYDPLLDPPPLPHSPITLIGGTVTQVDEIQNRITVRPFSGKQRLHMNFDIRTHIFLDGQAATERDLKPGERVYLDTLLNGNKVFAKSIWIRNSTQSGNGRGQILRYDSRADTITLKDEVSAEPVSFRLDSATIIHKGDMTGSVADLKPGSLVAITFDPAQGRLGGIRELYVLAEPGTAFTFMGRITFVDLSQKLIAVINQSDEKNYDIYFDSVPFTVLQGLREGSQTSITAVFDGSRYVAQKVDLILVGKTVPNRNNRDARTAARRCNLRIHNPQ
jgi:hypothetical protein